ncbi:TPR domain-containing protein [Colletotrichum higginsianum]|uniref:TPR domain-containing protein n=1 Tax=Colletotrichum higginsianum (strain IMI 349063) TaxID=759273 RepID=H1VMM7_COLHI|nr:TPR domain-containing protein [Colletotrichum higginsianum]
MAYYALEQFSLCAERLQQALALNPGNKDTEKDLERTTRKYMQGKLFYDQQQQEETSYTTCGIWATASFVNCSCLRNRHRSCIGDMLILREKKKAVLKQTFQKRQDLIQEVYPAVATSVTKAHETTILKMLSKLEDTYANGNVTQVLTVSEIYQALSKRHVVKGKAMNSLELAIKGLVEALDFDIFASPPNKSSGIPVLEIKKWDHVNESRLIVFLAMYADYLKVAPRLCEAVRGCTETSYLMLCGEKETFGQLEYLKQAASLRRSHERRGGERLPDL